MLDHISSRFEQRAGRLPPPPPHVIPLGTDTSRVMGKPLLTVIGAIGQFEREMMLERRREGIATAKVKKSTRAGRRRREQGRLRLKRSLLND